MLRAIISLSSGLILSSCLLSAVAGLNTDQDRLGYALGAMAGQSLKKEQVEMNPQSFVEGFNTAFAGKKLEMSDKDIHKTVTNFQKEAYKKLEDKMQEQSKDNSKSATDFFAENKSKPGVQTTASGLQYKVLTAGSGTSPAITDKVSVDYEGKLLDGKVFDSSYKRGKPASFPVNAVIKGWTEALQLMKPGATWELYIPANLAYGSNGIPGVIPPNSTLIFKVHLISVEK